MSVSDYGSALVALMNATEDYLLETAPEHPLCKAWLLYGEGAYNQTKEDVFVAHMNDYLSAPAKREPSRKGKKRKNSFLASRPASRDAKRETKIKT